MALVQSNISIQTGQTGSTPGLAYTATPTAGNTLVVCAAAWEAGNNPVANPTASGHTFISALALPTLSGGDNTGRISYEENCPGTAASVSVDCTGSGAADITYVILELSGVPTSSVLDGTGVTATGTSTAPSTGNKTPTSYTSQLVGLVMHDGVNTTITEDGAWTLIRENEGGTSNMPISAIYRTLTSGADDASWTFGASRTWSCGVVAFLPASAPATKAPPIPKRRLRPNLMRS